MKILVVCLGSVFYRDDRAGLEVCRRLQEHGYRNNIVMCDMGFERCLGEMLKRGFNILIIVDAVVPFGELKPGDIVFVEGFENINESLVKRNVVNTHKLSLDIVLDFIRSIKGDFKPIFIGICIKDLSICDEEFEECKLSFEVEESVNKIVNFLIDLLGEEN